MKEFIPVNEPLLNGNEKKYLNECIDTGWISSEGPFVCQLEELFAGKVNRKHGITVSNGSAALELAVKALGIGQGDEVIMPAFTIISCALAVIRVGALPVLIDSDPLTWNMDAGQIESKITSRTKAIMVVHIYGLPADMDIILEIAKKYDLMIIEDAAEMHGQSYHGKPCGSFGDISIFSFYPNKLITTGEGGIIVTDRDDLAEKCRSYKNLCFVPEERFVHYEMGWNFRFTNLQAAVGLAQLERWEEFILIKRKIGKLYTALLKNVPGLILPLEKTEYADNIYWVFGILLDHSVRLDAKKVMKLLNKKNIGTRPFFYPMHLQPVFKKMKLFSEDHFPESERLYERGFYLPSGLKLSEDQIHTVASSLIEVLS